MNCDDNKAVASMEIDCSKLNLACCNNDLRVAFIMHRIGSHFTRLSKLTDFSSGFNMLGVFLGIFGTIATLAPSSGRTVENLPVALLCVVLVLWVFGREFYLARKQKYANITPHYASISLHASRLSTDLIDDIAHTRRERNHNTKVTDEVFSEKIGRILDDFAAMFDLLTATKCRTSIKVVVRPPTSDTNEAHVFCFARDHTSSVSNKISDIKRAKENFDLISSNTDFQSLLFNEGPSQDHYINNNIHKSISNGTFKSSSIAWFRRARIDIGEYSAPTYHVLPYRSTMVWPIRTFDTTQRNIDESKFIGFLCVDSEHRNVFSPRFDKSLGLAVASQLVGLFYLKQQLTFLSNSIAEQGERNEATSDASQRANQL